MLVSADKWLSIHVPEDDARHILFCIPYAGGGASAYHSWIRELAPEITVCPIQLPGHEERFNEPPFGQLLELIETLGSILQPYLSVPFSFFGHSMGALIAFELARSLRRRYNLLPTHLFVSASQAPQSTELGEPIHQLADGPFLEQVIQRYNAIPQAILKEKELLQFLLPALKADFCLIETYSYQEEEPLACPITALGGTEDARVPVNTLHTWEAFTQKEFVWQTFEGGHFFLREQRKAIFELISLTLQHTPATTLQEHL